MKLRRKYFFPTWIIFISHVGISYLPRGDRDFPSSRPVATSTVADNKCTTPSHKNKKSLPVSYRETI